MAQPTPPPTTAQGAGEVLDCVAGVQAVQGQGGGAYQLEYDGNGTGFAVIAGDGEGDAFSLLVHTEDDKLAGLGAAGYQGGLHDHPGDGGVEGFLL